MAERRAVRKPRAPARAGKPTKRPAARAPRRPTAAPRPRSRPPYIPREPPRASRPTMIEAVPLSSARGATGFLLLLLLSIFLSLVVLPELVNLIAGREPAENEISPALLWFNVAAQCVFFFLLPLAYLRLVRPGESALGLLGLRMDARTPANIAIGLGIAVAATFALGLFLYAMRAAGLITEPESPLVEDLAALVRAHPEFLLVAPLAAGLFEETLFRGFFQPRLGLIGANIVFGLVHLAYGTIVQLVVPFVLGLGLSLLYRWRRSLWAPVTAHVAFDVVQLLLLYTVEPA